MNEQSTDALKQELAVLKVRCFDAETAAKSNGEMLQGVVQKVCELAEIDGIESLDQFFEKLVTRLAGEEEVVEEVAEEVAEEVVEEVED